MIEFRVAGQVIIIIKVFFRSMVEHVEEMMVINVKFSDYIILKTAASAGSIVIKCPFVCWSMFWRLRIRLKLVTVC